MPATTSKPKPDMVERVRYLLKTRLELTDLEEKKMFGGLAFMIRGLMGVTARPERIMCRIDPEMHDEWVKRPGCSTMEMKGRVYRGYLFVTADALSSDRDLKFWIEKVLAYNQSLVENQTQKKTSKAKPSRKKAPSQPAPKKSNSRSSK